MNLIEGREVRREKWGAAVVVASQRWTQDCAVNSRIVPDPVSMADEVREMVRIVVHGRLLIEYTPLFVGLDLYADAVAEIARIA